MGAERTWTTRLRRIIRITRSTGLILTGIGFFVMLWCASVGTNGINVLISEVLAGLNGAMFLLWLIKPTRERD